MISGIGAAARVKARRRIGRCLDLDQTSQVVFVPAVRNKGVLPHLGIEAKATGVAAVVAQTAAFLDLSVSFDRLLAARS